MLGQYQSPRLELGASEFRTLRDMIHRNCGIWLSDDKAYLVQTRLQKRLRLLNLGSFRQYLHYLENTQNYQTEFQEMINRITTNKTSFFRESYHFDLLREKVLAHIPRVGGQRRCRIWSAACSTGEEPYSIAITLREHCQPAHSWDVRVLASDIDSNVLRTASSAVYPEESVEEMSDAKIAGYFKKQKQAGGDLYEVRPDVRSLVTFRQINLMDSPWPIQVKFDAIFCRNVMIYFDDTTQQKLVERFARALQPGGHLFIGHSEKLGSNHELFESVGQTVYRLRDNPLTKAYASTRNLTSLRKPSTPRNSDVRSSAPTCPPAAAMPPVAAFSPAPFPAANYSTPNGVPLSFPTASFPAASFPAASFPAANVAAPSFTSSTSANLVAGAATPAGLSDPLPSKALIVGCVHASATPMLLTTLVGSCVVACLFDPEAKIGGMNHFALPGSTSNRRGPSVYGIHAMELLINEIMKLGGTRSNLKAKVFGGAESLDDTKMSSQVAPGSKNCEFIRSFLELESIPIVAEKLGGDVGLQVRFWTHTGRAAVRELSREDRLPVDVSETVPPQIEVATRPADDSVTLL